MKPQLAAIATGSASSTGSAPVAAISAASTGMMPLAVATLLANSVINMVSATIVAASRIVGTLPSGASTAPSQAASPPAVIAAASASPPPNIIMTPHGARAAPFPREGGPPGIGKAGGGGRGWED